MSPMGSDMWVIAVCGIIPRPESNGKVDRECGGQFPHSTLPSRTQSRPDREIREKSSRKKGDRMKRLIVAALFIASAGVSLQAEEHHIKANIPFGFRAGQTPMPAGEYVIEENGALLVLREAGGKNVCTLLSFAADAPKTGNAHVTFHRYGDTYFLNSIWDGSSGVGREVTQPRLERELARNRGRRPVVTAILASK